MRRYKRQLPELLRIIAAQSAKEIKEKPMPKFAEVRKAVVAGAGSVVTLTVAFTDTFTLLPADVSQVLAWVTAVGTGVVTYLTRNDVADVIDRY